VEGKKLTVDPLSVLYMKYAGFMPFITDYYKWT